MTYDQSRTLLFLIIRLKHYFLERLLLVSWLLFFFLLVEPALAERDSKNAVVSFFCRWDLVHAFLAKTVETGDKNRGDFHCMQMSLVMSMRYIFGDDWNGACKFGKM